MARPVDVPHLGLDRIRSVLDTPTRLALVCRAYDGPHTPHRRNRQRHGDDHGGNDELTARGLLNFIPIHGETLGEVVPGKSGHRHPPCERSQVNLLTEQTVNEPNGSIDLSRERD